MPFLRPGPDYPTGEGTKPRPHKRSLHWSSSGPPASTGEIFCAIVCENTVTAPDRWARGFSASHAETKCLRLFQKMCCINDITLGYHRRIRKRNQRLQLPQRRRLRQHQRSGESDAGLWANLSRLSSVSKGNPVGNWLLWIREYLCWGVRCCTDNSNGDHALPARVPALGQVACTSDTCRAR